MTADRFDMPRIMVEFLNVAVRNRTIDAAEVWALACNHGTDWKAMRDEIIMAAFNNRHCNLAAHSELCKLNDECYRVLHMNMAPTIHFN